MVVGSTSCHWGCRSMLVSVVIVVIPSHHCLPSLSSPSPLYSSSSLPYLSSPLLSSVSSFHMSPLSPASTGAGCWCQSCCCCWHAPVMPLVTLSPLIVPLALVVWYPQPLSCRTCPMVIMLSLSCCYCCHAGSPSPSSPVPPHEQLLMRLGVGGVSS